MADRPSMPAELDPKRRANHAHNQSLSGSREKEHSLSLRLQAPGSSMPAVQLQLLPNWFVLGARNSTTSASSRTVFRQICKRFSTCIYVPTEKYSQTKAQTGIALYTLGMINALGPGFLRRRFSFPVTCLSAYTASMTWSQTAALSLTAKTQTGQRKKNTIPPGPHTDIGLKLLGSHHKMRAHTQSWPKTPVPHPWPPCTPCPRRDTNERPNDLSNEA